MKHWRDVYLLVLIIVSVVAFQDSRFSRWMVGLSVAMWIVFAILNAVAYTRSYNSRFKD